MKFVATPTRNKRHVRQHFHNLAAALDYAGGDVTGFNFYGGRGELTAVLPYAELRDEARQSACRLMGLDLPRGTRIAIVASTEPGFHKIFFACQYAGLTPVPVPPPLQLGGHQSYVAYLKRLLAISDARVCIGSKDYADVMAESCSGLPMRFVGSFETFSTLAARPVSLRPSDPGEPAYLQFTSGSTQFPRGVMIAQEAVMSNLYRTTTHLQITEDDRAVSWLPYYHDMGLVGMILAPMTTQMSVDYLGSREFAMRPRQWLLRMSESHATISFGPPFGYELCTRRIRDSTLNELDLSAWRVAGVGADHIRPQTLADFARRMQVSGFDPRAFLPCYGLAESTLAVTLGRLNAGVEFETIDRECLAHSRFAKPVFEDQDEADRTTVSEFVDCGLPLADHELEIRDSNGNGLPDRCRGRVFVRGPSVMSGYIGESTRTVEIHGRGEWLETGDSGYVVDSRLFVTGREKDMMVCNGRNVWPQDMEFIAERFDDIRTGDASAFGVPDREGSEQAVIVVQCRAREPAQRRELIRHLRGAIMRELGVDCLVDLVPPHTLVRTSSGKQSRASNRAAYFDRTRSEPGSRLTAIAGGDRGVGRSSNELSATAFAGATAALITGSVSEFTQGDSEAHDIASLPAT